MNQTLTGSTVVGIAANVGERNTEAAVPKQLGLVNKLCQIMAAVGYVQKTGYNKFHGYKYATEADLVDMIRGELAQRNIFVFPDVKEYTRIPIEVETMKGTRKTQISEIKVAWTFVDGDTGQERTVHVHGVGEDNMDKGFYKAFTGSEKYLLMKSFLIPTGDDPEADSKTDSKAVQGKANGAGVESETAESPKEPPNVYLEPGKQGFCTITGEGLAVMLVKLFETEKTILGLAYDGNFWTVPIANAFRFADACVKHGVGVVHMDSGAARTSAPNGGGAQPSPASPSPIIKATYPKSGTTKSTKEKPAREWACLEVIYDDNKYLCWDKTLWPYLEEAGRKKLTALLQTTKSFDGKKSPTIEGILRIGDTEFEVIEGRSVPVIQRV